MTTRFAAISALAIAAVAASSCGGASSAPAAPSAPSSGVGANVITITGQNGNRSFSPNPASLGGLQVVFRNNDTVVHRVQLNDGSMDTGNIQPGATSNAVAMPSSGTNYHCPLHPAMVGAISPSSGGAPPPCDGAYC